MWNGKQASEDARWREYAEPEELERLSVINERLDRINKRMQELVKERKLIMRRCIMRRRRRGK